MKLENLYAVDDDSFENGKWLMTQAGLEVKIRSMNHPLFKAEIVKLQKPFLDLLTSKVDTTELLEKITVKGMAKTILLDWKDEEAYSFDLGVKYLTKYQEFREDISTLSANMDNFRPEKIVEK